MSLLERIHFLRWLISPVCANDYSDIYIGGLVQDCSEYIASALELLLSSTKQSIYYIPLDPVCQIMTYSDEVAVVWMWFIQ